MTGLTHQEWLAAEKARGDLARQTYQTEAAKRRERLRRQLRAAHAKLDAIEAAEREERTRQRQAGKARAPIGNPLALARARHTRKVAAAHETSPAVAAMDASQEPLCESCEASFRVDGDTLCAACRAEVDATYDTLPEAAP